MNRLSLQKILVAALLGASLPLAVHARTQSWPTWAPSEYAGPVQSLIPDSRSRPPPAH